MEQQLNEVFVKMTSIVPFSKDGKSHPKILSLGFEADFRDAAHMQVTLTLLNCRLTANKPNVHRQASTSKEETKIGKAALPGSLQTNVSLMGGPMFEMHRSVLVGFCILLFSVVGNAQIVTNYLFVEVVDSKQWWSLRDRIRPGSQAHRPMIRV
jgi:hypothetical protein